LRGQLCRRSTGRAAVIRGEFHRAVAAGDARHLAGRQIEIQQAWKDQFPIRANLLLDPPAVAVVVDAVAGDGVVDGIPAIQEDPRRSVIRDDVVRANDVAIGPLDERDGAVLVAQFSRVSDPMPLIGGIEAVATGI